jgi:site-specific DNA-methyltransferase (adenine-specific)
MLNDIMEEFIFGANFSRLYQGDCLQIMQTLEAGSIDLVLTDPPYGMTECKWDTVIPLIPMWEGIHHCTSKNAAVLMTAGQPFTSALIMSNPNEFKYCWVWDKGVSGSFAIAKYMPLKTHEDICLFSSGTPSYFPQMTKRDKPAKIGGVNSGSRQAGRAIQYNPTKLRADKIYTEAYPKTIQYFSPRAAGQRGLHPTQKPVALMEYLIRTYTKKGDTVMDFTMGSGTTGVACKRLGRNFVGIELDPGYFEIASKRISEAATWDADNAE